MKCSSQKARSSTLTKTPKSLFTSMAMEVKTSSRYRIRRCFNQKTLPRYSTKWTSKESTKKSFWLSTRVKPWVCLTELKRLISYWWEQVLLERVHTRTNTSQRSTTTSMTTFHMSSTWILKRVCLMRIPEYLSLRQCTQQVGFSLTLTLSTH